MLPNSDIIHFELYPDRIYETEYNNDDSPEVSLSNYVT